jgi:hypothetical protein
MAFYPTGSTLIGMPTDPAVVSLRQESLVLGAAVLAAFFIVRYLNAAFLHLEGFVLYAVWFLSGFVLIVVFLGVFRSLARRLPGRLRKREGDPKA